MRPKYIAGPMRSRSKAKFIPHMGNKVPFGMVKIASTYLIRITIFTIKLTCKLVFFNFFTRVEVVPSVPLKRLHKLSRSIVVWDVEPKTMRNCSWHTFTETEGVTANKICTFSIRFVESVEKVRCGWAENVFYMLLKCINLFSRWIVGNLSHSKR